jgi:RNA polymerase sigma factor (sigma-70 family)
MTAPGPNERNKLVARHMYLALAVARDWYRTRRHLRDDIESAAMYGLTRAVDGYDKSLNVKFETYARRAITHEIQHEIRQSRPRGYRRHGDGKRPPEVLSLIPTDEERASRPRGAASPEPELDRRESWEALLARFRPGHRPIMRLLFEDDLTITEVADVLGLTRRETLAIYSSALAGIDTKARVPLERPARAVSPPPCYVVIDEAGDMPPGLWPYLESLACPSC